MSSLQVTPLSVELSMVVINSLRNLRQVGFLRSWECEFSPCCQSRENSLKMKYSAAMVRAVIDYSSRIDCYHLNISSSSKCGRVQSLDFLPKFEILTRVCVHLSYAHQWIDCLLCCRDVSDGYLSGGQFAFVSDIHHRWLAPDHFYSEVDLSVMITAMMSSSNSDFHTRLKLSTCGAFILSLLNLFQSKSQLNPHHGRSTYSDHC